MTKVTIRGWHEGLNKVQLNHLLRKYSSMGLREAKHAVDRLLDGESLTIDSPDRDSALEFYVSARALGAECSDPIEVSEEAFAGPEVK